MARICHCCGSGVGPAAVILILPLAWEPPYAGGAALRRPKKKKKKKICGVVSLFSKLTSFKKTHQGVPVVVQWKRIHLGTMRLHIRSLASLSGLRIGHCCELCCRSAATALIRPLAWKPPHAEGVALKRQKTKNK